MLGAAVHAAVDVVVTEVERLVSGDGFTATPACDVSAHDSVEPDSALSLVA